MTGAHTKHQGYSHPRAMRVERREFLVKSGWFGAGLMLSRLPAALRARGWLDVASAQEADLTRDTLNALVAFVVPGPDEYSVAQGQSTKRRGGLDAGTTDVLITSLDNFVPASAAGEANTTVPLSGAVANLLNANAAQVNPAAAAGPFPSNFARLTYEEKIEVFRLIESTSGTDDASRNIRFVGGILPGFVAFLSYTEWSAFDPETRELTGQPIGWKLSGYQPNGPREGWAELKGYYRGRRKASS